MSRRPRCAGTAAWPGIGMFLLASLSWLACDDDARPQAQRQRANALSAAASAQTSASAPTTASAPAAKRSQLCAAHPPSSAPRTEPRTRTAPGAMVPAHIPFGAGKWIWVNLWAAWCGPCKDEIPLVRRFETAMRKAGIAIDVAFVSLDDDERELDRFLAAQPEGGLRATYWLEEGADRKAFLSTLGVGDATALPIHALYDPKGELACFLNGAMEVGDYDALRAVVSSR